MKSNYRDITIADLEQIYLFTRSELSDKETLYSVEPNDELNTQISGLREVVINIEKELLIRRTSNSID